jgi:hypothetical protein
MAININNTNVSSDKDVYFNGTSLATSKSVYLDGTRVWRKEQELNDSTQHCIDHYIKLRYDGSGLIEIAGAEPSGSVHTGRGDCGGVAQGWYTAINFSTTGWVNVEIEITYPSGGGSTGGTYTTTVAVGTSISETTINSSNAYGNNGSHQPTVATKATLSF